MGLRRRKTIKFQGRNHSRFGIGSMLIGIIVTAVFLAIAFISSAQQGQGNLWLGTVGLIAFAVSILGLLIGIRSFKEKDIFYVAPIVGLIMNGIMTIVLFCLYIVGLVS